MVDPILAVNAGAYSFEAANPRHEHEWRVWKDVRLPEDTVLMPGVVTQSTVLVEHPRLSPTGSSALPPSSVASA